MGMGIKRFSMAYGHFGHPHGLDIIFWSYQCQPYHKDTKAYRNMLKQGNTYNNQKDMSIHSLMADYRQTKRHLFSFSSIVS